MYFFSFLLVLLISKIIERKKSQTNSNYTNLQQQATEDKGREKNEGDLTAFVKAEEDYMNPNNDKVTYPKCDMPSINDKN